MRVTLAIATAMLLSAPLQLYAQCSGDSCTTDRNLPSTVTSNNGQSREVQTACGLIRGLFGRRGCSSCNNVTQQNPQIDAAPAASQVTMLTPVQQRLIHQATVGIVSDSKDGKRFGLTGTVVDIGSTHATILTDAHGLYKYDKVYISYPQGMQAEGRVLAINEKYDCALIEAERPENVVPIGLADPNIPKKLTHVGYKSDGSLWVEEGNFLDWVSASHNVGYIKSVPARKTDYHQLGKSQLAMTGHVAAQESGGGVYDDQGRLAGMVWGGERLKNSSVVYATNMNDIRKFLNDHSADIPVTAGERWAAADKTDDPFRSIEQLADAGEEAYTTFPRRQPQVQVQIDYSKILDLMAKDGRFKGNDGDDGDNGLSPTADQVAAVLKEDSQFLLSVKGDPGKIDNETVKNMTIAIHNELSKKIPTVSEIVQATLAEITIPTAEEIAAKVKTEPATVDPEQIAEIVNAAIADLSLDVKFVDSETKQQIGNVVPVKLQSERLILERGKFAVNK